MNGRWLGAMPVDIFLDRYLPAATEHPLPDLPDNPFDDVPEDKVESKHLNHFITAIKAWMSHLDAVNTSTKSDTVNPANSDTAVSLYNRIKGVAPPDKTDFSRLELWMAFNAIKVGADFQDPPNDIEDERILAIEKGSLTPDSDNATNARAQLICCAEAHHGSAISRSRLSPEGIARFLRWDPSATVVTASLNYRNNLELLAAFLSRFAHFSRKQRGHDISIQPANLTPEVDACIREKLGIKKDAPLYQYEVPGLIGKGHAVGPRQLSDKQPLVAGSRCTRTSPMLWIPSVDVTRSCGEGIKDPWSEERLIYVKDTWRFLMDKMLPEHKVHEMLRSCGTLNIQEPVAGGNFDRGKTRADELVDAPLLCVQPEISSLQHYRLIHVVVGRPLWEFDCTKQLVTAFLDALQAHSQAVNTVKILQRDISVGNIILMDGGRGLLIDWEMAKVMNGKKTIGAGTRQFLSGDLLQNPEKAHTLTDDLESFLHVLGWLTLRYIPATDSYPADDHYQDMYTFEDNGWRKCTLLESELYPSTTFQSRRKAPLFELVAELSLPFKSRYSCLPDFFTRGNATVYKRKPWRMQLYRSYCYVKRYDEDMGIIASHTWFIDTIKKALETQEWPTDDKAEANPLPLRGEAKRQEPTKTNQRRCSEDVCETSDASANELKRAASPMSRPSAKRVRGPSVVSGTGE